MSIKNKVLAEINKKAQKIRDKRVEAASNKSLEDAAFQFFKNIEESRLLHNGEKYDPVLFETARRSLAQRVQNFDRGAKISVEWNVSEDLQSWETGTVRGVTVWWGKAYIAQHNVDPSFYIDVSQMLFI